MSLYLLEEYDKLHKRQARSPKPVVEVGSSDNRIHIVQVKFYPDELLQETEPLIMECSATSSKPPFLYSFTLYLSTSEI